MYLQLGKFVAMPNHFHAILIIGDNEYNFDDPGRDDMRGVSTKTNHQPFKNQFNNQSNNLASVVRGYKSSVTTWARKNNIAFDWQARYHDHIIRNYEEYLRISRYIQMNVSMWKEDRFYT